jgi:hypothetical protein
VESNETAREAETTFFTVKVVRDLTLFSRSFTSRAFWTLKRGLINQNMSTAWKLWLVVAEFVVEERKL